MTENGEFSPAWSGLQVVDQRGEEPSLHPQQCHAMRSVEPEDEICLFKGFGSPPKIAAFHHPAVVFRKLGP